MTRPTRFYLVGGTGSQGREVIRRVGGMADVTHWRGEDVHPHGYDVYVLMAKFIGHKNTNQARTLGGKVVEVYGGIGRTASVILSMASGGRLPDHPLRPTGSRGPSRPAA